ncbi:unnamed protein product [Aphanomyces euteiches]|uniref:Uncharacterized protein n=1 Tax=Aphanomyces euteiches TaxID=100861 RepID=A0A6G0WAR2_9STRA|nr:hypothetical protein Ae201684_019143 [Aphanomyces euteiches]KAF0723359.1 hypothetical protein Ae201684_017701 [Aphanomyces euteiches]KAF0723364.1 hypothetical protein Ae201684_017706 [Aphanomyces euteiches]KAH9095444.1 hypothetical protein Ae201684P_014514 [Aphanomyces euteiches]KAH9095500.1 hypothetical protein Ae201684P_014566 [Aphanomyces euteiches]
MKTFSMVTLVSMVIAAVDATGTTLLGGDKLPHEVSGAFGGVGVVGGGDLVGRGVITGRGRISRDGSIAGSGRVTGGGRITGGGALFAGVAVVRAEDHVDHIVN